VKLIANLPLRVEINRSGAPPAAFTSVIADTQPCCEQTERRVAGRLALDRCAAVVELPIATTSLSALEKPLDHPSERILKLYVANQVGIRRRKVINEHLDQCAGCQRVVAHARIIARRLRDFEKVALRVYSSGRRDKESQDGRE
jgi:hypothetical protein